LVCLIWRCYSSRNLKHPTLKPRVAHASLFVPLLLVWVFPGGDNATKLGVECARDTVDHSRCLTFPSSGRAYQLRVITARLLSNAARSADHTNPASGRDEGSVACAAAVRCRYAIDHIRLQYPCHLISHHQLTPTLPSRLHSFCVCDCKPARRRSLKYIFYHPPPQQTPPITTHQTINMRFTIATLFARKSD
jgi:hypothetical protein